LENFLESNYRGVNTENIQKYLKKNEYSYRKAKQCAYLQLEYPEIWKETMAHRQEETNVISQIHGDQLMEYVKKGYNPETFINSILKNDDILQDYGKCVELSGSLWAFLGSALYKRNTTTKSEEE
jgi:hypothetical protein